MADVLIKGFKMPENCWNCPFLHTSEHYIGDDKILLRHTCLRTGERTDENVTGYLKNCPLVEIPPHGRLIDADALINILQELFDTRKTAAEVTGYTGTFVSWNDAIYHIKNAPTVIPTSEVDHA